MNIIYIFWLRQIKKYFRSKARLFGSLGQPALFLVALGFGFGPIFEKAGGGNYIAFLTPGIVTQAILFTAVFSGVDLIWDKEFGFLKETLAAPVPRMNIIIGRILGSATIATFQGVIVLIISLFIGFVPVDFLRTILGIFIMFVIACLFTALGSAFASALDDLPGFQFVMNLLLMPMFFLSGALFPLDNLPSILQIVARLNPLAYGVDALRSCLVSISHFGLTLDFFVLWVLCFAFIGIANYLFSKTQI